jgi:hypothetical protein
MIKSLRHFTGVCSLISIEKAETLLAKPLSPAKSTNYSGEQAFEGTKVVFYAVDSLNKKLCPCREFRKLFAEPAKARLSKEWSRWTSLFEVMTSTPKANGSALNSEETAAAGLDASGLIGRWLSVADLAAVPLIGWHSFELIYEFAI